MTFNPKEHLIQLKNKDYLETKWRLLWFRDEHPKGQIITELVNLSPLIYKATVMDGSGGILATGHGSAVAKQGAVWAGREVEKAETAAIGRALGHAGYGTQFTDEDEGDYLADSPVERPNNGTRPTPPTQTPGVPSRNGTHESGGDTKVVTWPSAESLTIVLNRLQGDTGILEMSMSEFARLAGVENADDLDEWKSKHATGSAAHKAAMAAFEARQTPARSAQGQAPAAPQKTVLLWTYNRDQLLVNDEITKLYPQKNHREKMLDLLRGSGLFNDLTSALDAVERVKTYHRFRTQDNLDQTAAIKRMKEFAEAF